MTSKEAHTLMATLLAAFHRQRIESATVKIYVAALERLEREQATRAVAALIESVSWFPTIAEIREEYLRHPPAPPRALDEPELTPEQRIQNLQRISEIRARLAGISG